MNDWIAKLRAHGGELTLGGDLKWKMTRPMPDYVVAQVLHECRNYEYSTADGYPGVYMAHLAAKSVGGTVEVNKLPELPEGAIA